ncbi:pentatricopeptide repeat-containing protein [Prunus yedoensis var. nudiflora]|uniref:Pentatricopeptide repeat-containing protein n=1 Tax=Prunus yedoensis var. nudiflora TaxID=2094558 RepID=A0A314Z7Y6_PRUYE|nr:pentatricopeptide repeat-containing protein [Prunus yedoensis var. nudiflora]
MSLPAYTATPIQLLQLPKQPPLLHPLPNPSHTTSPNPTHHKKHSVYQEKKTQKPIDPTVSWTSSISHRCRNGQLAEAVEHFIRMRRAGIEPNHITFVTLFSGCAHFPLKGGLFGASLHAYARKLGLDTNNVMVGTAVIDMYAKCGGLDFSRLVFDGLYVKNSMSWNTMIDGYMKNGKVDDAVKLFEQMPQRDAVSWTVLIGGFVKKGQFEQALEWFREMQLSGVEPDYVTLIAVIAACADLGTLGLGLWINRRAGMLEDALNVIENMPMKPNEVVVGSLLAACRTNGNINLAERLMKYLYELDPGVDSNYVLLANIYAADGRWDGASRVRNTMKAHGIQKTPGFSSVEIDCDIHEFVAGDKSHVDAEHIYSTLELLSFELKLCGFLEGSRKQRDQLYLAFRTARAVFQQGPMDLRSLLLLLMVDEESYNWC